VAKGKILQARPEIASDPLPIGPLDDLISVLLRRVEIHLTRGFIAATAEQGVRIGVISSLALIASNPGISQNELALHTVFDKSGIVAIVDSLEELGWAVRKTSKADRRRHALYVTAEGRVRLKKFAASVRKVEAELLATIPPEDLDYLRKLLERMHLACLSALQIKPGERG
jgi:DNA-binding MarR family transcriptional regulator